MTDVNFVVPLGEDCQLGAALEFFGYQESSLLKWANTSSSQLLSVFLDGLNNAFAQPKSRTLFQPPNGKVGIIENQESIQLPNNGGWGTYRDYMAILKQFSPNQLITTAVTGKEHGFTHGIRMSVAKIRDMTYDEIEKCNQEKLAYLRTKTLNLILKYPGKILFIRAQRVLNEDSLSHIKAIYDILSKTRAYPFDFHIVTTGISPLTNFLEEGIEISHFVNFSPKRNPMLLRDSFLEWKQFFLRLGVPQQAKWKTGRYFSGLD